MMDDLNLDIAEILKYAGWAAVAITALSTLFTMGRARRWKPIGTRLVITAAIGSAITLGSLLWTHLDRVSPQTIALVVIAGVVAGFVTARGLNVRRSSLGAVAKRSVLWAAAWGIGLVGVQMAAAIGNLELVAPSLTVVGAATGGLLGVGIRLIVKKQRLPVSNSHPGETAQTAQLPRPPSASKCRSCRRPLKSSARFCDQCGVAVLQNARR